MESFRKAIKGWFGKVLLVLFLIPFAFVGIEGLFSSKQSEDTVETVNGQPISKKELEQVSNSFKQQYLQYTNGDETLLNQTFIQEQALESIVKQALLQDQAKKLGISLSNKQIELMIQQQPSFQENGKFSPELFEQYLKSQGFPNSESFIAGIRQDHALKMLTSTLTSFPLVSQQDVKQIVDLQIEQRTLHLASINLDKYKQGIQVTAKDIQNYYNKHSKSLKQFENVDVDFIEISPENITTANLETTDAELQQAYQKFVEISKATAKPVINQILITTEGRTEAQAKQRADVAYDELNKGATFANVAAKYSEDPNSKNNGGTLSAYEKGAFGEAFDTTVESLKSGQTSAPVKTQYGYQIIQVLTPTVDVPSFDSKKDELLAQVKKAKTENAFSDAVNSLNELVVSNDALDVVSQEIKGTQVQSVKKLSLSTHHPVLSHPNVKVKLFNEDVKNGDRNASSSIQLENGNIVWVKVRAYHPAGVQTLAEATPRIKTKIIEEKAIAAAKAEIAKTLAEFKTEPATTVLAKSKLHFEGAGEFTRDKLMPQIEKVAFSLPTPKQGMWSVSTASLPNELIVVAVSAVNHELAKDLKPEDLDGLKQAYMQLRGQQELDAYTQYLKSNAKIVKNK
ncbi:peptidylprolyl isomerase [Acinetobacter sp. ANC 4558]|uniref:SurA N-terminal domain-containing protein n=1 Tax=Acinetobacter sp. ANC 4558 TaxID=1977876 RepID=UPI000A33C127|nr:SurA N-terminal domain-containing protein [Acinetobacter sp. ANC 4558]OTG88372.1 peptidylprolyl isomerase [Acinetobacter sp. ANC 4558]